MKKRKGLRLSGLAQRNLERLRASWGGTKKSVVERIIMEAEMDAGLPEKKAFSFFLSKPVCEKLVRLCRGLGGVTETEAMSIITERAVRSKPVIKQAKPYAPNLGRKHIPGGRND